MGFALILTLLFGSIIFITTSAVGFVIGFVISRIAGRKIKGIEWRSTLVGALAGIVVTCSLAIYLFGFFPNGKEELAASARSSDGVEFRVVQSFTAEPYQITFMVKRPDQKLWSAFYIEHEDFRWRRASFVIDELNKEARLFKNSRQAASYNWSTATFNLTYSFNRSITAPEGEWQMPTDWAPPAD